MTTLFKEVIERKTREKDANSAKFERRNEVKALFNQVVEDHKKELEQHFSVSSYTNGQVKIEKGGYGYSAELSSTKEIIYIGYKANSAGGKNSIPFKYTDNNSKLVGIFKNALKLLVKEAW